MSGGYRYFGLLAVIPGILLCLSCAGSRFPVIRPVPEARSADRDLVRAQEYFIKARDYERRGLGQMTEHFYELAYEFDPSSRTLRNLLARQFIESGKFTQALLLIRGAVQSDSLDDEERRILAAVYLKTGQFQRAAAMIDSVSTKTPEEYYSLGLIYESTGAIEKALKNYDAFFQNGPGTLENAVKIGALMLRLKQYGRAESLCVAMEQRFGQSSALLTFCGTVNLSKGDTAGAQNFFRMALISDSTNEDAMRSLAQISIVNNDYPGAIGYYQKLSSLASWGEIYGRTLAMLYYYDGRLADAELLLKNLLAEDVDDFELHYFLGLVFTDQKNFAMARMEYEKAIAIQSGYSEAWRQLCLLGVKEKDLDQALDDAQRFCRASSDNGTAWRLLGVVQDARKEYAKAAVSLRKAVAIDTTDAAALFELGSCLERQQKSDSSALIFRKVLVLKPGDASAANYLGYMWADANKNLDSAALLVRMALAKEPGNGAFIDSYAWVLFRQGALDSAHHYILKALKIISDDPVVFEHAGDILAAKGDTAGALKSYQRCLALNPENRAVIEMRIAALRKKQ